MAHRGVLRRPWNANCAARGIPAHRNLRRVGVTPQFAVGRERSFGTGGVKHEQRNRDRKHPIAERLGTGSVT